jgi:hypothetical protein
MAFQSLPIHLIIDNITRLLDNRDILNLVRTHRALYKEFFKLRPDFRETYGRTYKIGCCLRRMIAFVRTGHERIASWGFYVRRHCFVIVRNSRTSVFCIDGLYREMPIDRALELFRGLILMDWGKMEMSTRCSYKSDAKRKEYMEITRSMQDLLG